MRRDHIMISLIKDSRELFAVAIDHLLKYAAVDPYMSQGELGILTTDLSEMINLNAQLEREVTEHGENVNEQIIDEMMAESLDDHIALGKRQDRIDELCRENDDLFVTIGQKDIYIAELESRTQDNAEYTLTLEDENMATVVQLLDSTTDFAHWPAEAEIHKYESVTLYVAPDKGVRKVPGIVVDAVMENGSMGSGVLYKVAYMVGDKLEFTWSWDTEVTPTGREMMDPFSQDILTSISYLIDSQLDSSLGFETFPVAPIPAPPAYSF